MDGNQRYHPQRKLRARQKEDTEVKVKKTKVTDILIYIDLKHVIYIVQSVLSYIV